MSEASTSVQKTFETQFQRLSDNWPLEPERGKRLTRAYWQMFQDFGELRFRAAVAAIVEARAYSLFPTEAEFRGYVPAAPKRQWCGKCLESWVYIEPNDRERGMKRCECAL